MTRGGGRGRAHGTGARPGGLRRSSLLWTFAGAFLLVLAVAAVLQVIVLAVAVGPVAGRWLRDRAAIIVGVAAEELSGLDADADRRAVHEVLRRHSQPPVHLFFRFEDGRGVGFGRGMGGPGRGRGVDPTADDRHDVLATVEVTGEHVRGTLLALAPRPRVALWPAGAPWRLLLFIPVALAVSAVAGLVLFRTVVRRLRALEALATRVAEGDLAARVPDPGRDEIGRLGTQLNRMTERLALARDRLAADDRTRRQLVADISHELSTPLTSIRGFTETLLDPDVALTDEERRRYLDAVVDESKRLDALIRDLLELTRLEAGAVTLERERLDWAALCRNTVDRFRSRFETAGLTLRWRPAGAAGGPSGAGSDGSEGAAGDGPVWVEADGRRLEQVLENLLVNALRYVPPGGCVEVTIEPAETTTDLVVTDDGPGFPPDDLPHVFDRFYRADPSRSTEGTGLGLAIVKEIAEMHGGRAGAETVSPHGARVRITLPRAASQHP